jgi:hypothetical protein
VKAVEDVEDGTNRSVEQDEDGGPSKPVKDDDEDGGPSKSVEDDVVDFVDKGTVVPAREVVPRCAAFPRAADDLQISFSSLK